MYFYRIFFLCFIQFGEQGGFKEIENRFKSEDITGMVCMC